ncbi:MAG: hypothetical protein ACREF3_17165 [Acetobacteraceae bacterium]
MDVLPWLIDYSGNRGTIGVYCHRVQRRGTYLVAMTKQVTARTKEDVASLAGSFADATYRPADSSACDTDYDGDGSFVRHAYFLGGKDRWEAKIVIAGTRRRNLLLAARDCSVGSSQAIARPA